MSDFDDYAVETMMDDPTPAITMDATPQYGMMSPEVAREVAQVQAQIAIAKMFPRDMSQVFKKLDASCSRLELAQKAMYVYPKGKTEVTGESIRLMEAVANSMGNMKYGFEQQAGDGASKVRAYAFDMENNVYAERIFMVDHKRDTKKGSYRLTDSREIYELCANNAARRIRACLQEIIPVDVVAHARLKCQEALASGVEINQDKIETMIKFFEVKYQVTREMLEAKIGRSMESITVPQYLMIQGIANSLKDKMGTPADYFDLSIGKEQEPVKGVAGLKAKMASEASKTADNASIAEEGNPNG